jgi:hypothetical protein
MNNRPVIVGAVVDLIGVSGVGKTTFKNRLTREKIDGVRIIDGKQLLRSPREPLMTMTQRCLGKWIVFTSGRRLNARTSANAQYNLAIDALKNQPSQFAKFLSFVLGMKLEKKLDPVVYCLALNWLFNAVVQRVAAECRPNNSELYLMDEPLTYRPSLFGVGVSDVVDDLVKFYQNVPLPKALIFIDAPTPVIVDRLMKRANSGGKLALRHRHLSRDEMCRDTDWGRSIAITGLGILAERGAQILTLSGAETIDTNVHLAREFLQTVIHTSGA